MEEFTVVLDFLRENEVEYAITGAAAMSVWGVIRASFDVDFVLLDSESRRRIVDFARGRGFDIILNMEGRVTLRDRSTLLEYDFLFARTEAMIEMCRNAKLKYAFGRRIRVAAPEDIILGKLWKMLESFNHDDARDILALATVSVLNMEYLCSRIKRSPALRAVLGRIVEDADSYRYKEMSLTDGAERLSTCL